MGKIVNKRELSEILGFNEKTLTEWQREGMPVEQKRQKKGLQNKYDTSKVVSWIRKYDSQKNVTELEIERSRLTKAQADYKELEVKQMEGDLLPVDLVLKTWAALITSAKTYLLSIPSSLKNNNPEITEKQLSTIKDVLRQVLGELSNSGLPAKLRKDVAKYMRDMDARSRNDAE